MIVLVMTAIVFLVILLILVGLAIGLGLLLHLIFPAVDLGIGMLIGLLATGISMHFAGRFLTGVPVVPQDELEELEEPTPPPTRRQPSGKRKRR